MKKITSAVMLPLLATVLISGGMLTAAPVEKSVPENSKETTLAAKNEGVLKAKKTKKKKKTHKKKLMKSEYGFELA